MPVKLANQKRTNDLEVQGAHDLDPALAETWIEFLIASRYCGEESSTDTLIREVSPRSFIS